MEHLIIINALKEVLSGNIGQNSQKDYIDFNEARQYLGVSASCLYKYRSNNIVPYYKIRKKLWFKKSELETFIKQGRVKSIYELQNDPKILTKNRKSK